MTNLEKWQKMTADEIIAELWAKSCPPEDETYDKCPVSGVINERICKRCWKTYLNKEAAPRQ